MELAFGLECYGCHPKRIDNADDLIHGLPDVCASIKHISVSALRGTSHRQRRVLAVVVPFGVPER